MPADAVSPLSALEPKLRHLLPATLYARAWVEPQPDVLMSVFAHLRTLRYILNDYVPRQVSADPPTPGRVTYRWQEGTLLFTDLAGFTTLVEANSKQGQAGADVLWKVLNAYFADMIEIVSKSGGDLLEFTGDAMLVQFSAGDRNSDTARAVKAGLRMQRTMTKFSCIEIAGHKLSLGMRVGIHTGRFLAADLGTPLRMVRVLLGKAVQIAKRAEGAGKVGRVCLTEVASDRLKDQFRWEAGQPGYQLAIDDLSDDQLGEYEITFNKRRPSSTLFDRSLDGIMGEIETIVRQVEPLVSYIPQPILSLLVENAADRQIPPDFPQPTVVFVNILGLSESVDNVRPEEESELMTGCSQVFALINAAVTARGGVLRNVTYHLEGSDILLYFGVINAHTDDASRAASAACAIRDIIANLPSPSIRSQAGAIACQIGMAKGPVFAAEIGEPRGRREFNILGDTVNTAARLMSRATANQILMTEAVYHSLAPRSPSDPLGFKCDYQTTVALKGKASPTPIYILQEQVER